MARLIAYCRVSTEEQTRGVSLEEQEERCRKYAEAMGHEVVKVYVDKGVSASVHPEDRGLGLAMLDCEANEADGLVAMSLDRYSRSLKHTIDLVEWAVEHRYSLISLRESLDTNSAAGRMIVNVLAAFNQFTREGIIEKTRGALDHLRTQGKVYGAIPWGKRRAGKHLETEPLEVAASLALQRCFVENPQMSYIVAAEWMNENFGFHPRKKVAWAKEDVGRLARRLRDEGGVDPSLLPPVGMKRDGTMVGAPKQATPPDVPGQMDLPLEQGEEEDADSPGPRGLESVVPLEKGLDTNGPIGQDLPTQ